MTKKINKHDKLFESLPRQSTVDQLKRIRAEINKSQKVKVGPDESIMKGDVGDRVSDDLIKHKGMNNLFWWDNPLDRHIDSYETFVKNDSRKSLGYTKNGDPKLHKGTDYVKENYDKILDDPYGEEIWPKDDEITLKIKNKLNELSKNCDFMINNKNWYHRWLKGRYDELLIHLSEGDKDNEKIFMIKGYEEGGPNDPGYTEGWVKGRNEYEAEAIWLIANKKISDVGNYVHNRTPQHIIDRKINKLRKELSMIEDMPSINSI